MNETGHWGGGWKEDDRPAQRDLVSRRGNGMASVATGVDHVVYFRSRGGHTRVTCWLVSGGGACDRCCMGWVWCADPLVKQEALVLYVPFRFEEGSPASG